MPAFRRVFVRVLPPLMEIAADDVTAAAVEVTMICGGFTGVKVCCPTPSDIRDYTITSSFFRLALLHYYSILL